MCLFRIKFILLKDMKSKISLSTLFLSLIFLITSCTVEPKEIQYGNDHCYHCDMTVVDKTHSAEYVTKKGKAYMFDAVECLVMKINKEQNEDLMAFILVADFANPGILVDAKTATYLISENIKSPMGANLSAFSIQQKAEEVMKEHGGELFTWEELKQKLAN